MEPTQNGEGLKHNHLRVSYTRKHGPKKPSRDPDTLSRSDTSDNKDQETGRDGVTRRGGGIEPHRYTHGPGGLPPQV